MGSTFMADGCTDAPAGVDPPPLLAIAFLRGYLTRRTFLFPNVFPGPVIECMLCHMPGPRYGV